MYLRIHREGILPLLIATLILAVLAATLIFLLPAGKWIFIPAALIFWFWLVRFFRNPPRPIPEKDDKAVYAPADGKVVVVEAVVESEYFQDERMQVSIFMSPNNVHVNRHPVSGKIAYVRYHSGKYLVAWHPKSSSENERNTVVYDLGDQQVLVRQIAGAVARRIRCYAKEGERVVQGEELGFIKFGSRVDLFLPLGATILVKPGQPVKGNVDVIARLP